MNFKNFINFLLGLFSPYANPFEKKIEKFLRGLKKDSYNDKVQKGLQGLMQENLAMLNLYLEWKSRGYKYLKKSCRKKIYLNLELLKSDFLSKADPSSNKFTANITEELKVLNLSYPVYKEAEINYLWQIMKYLEPGNRFTYQESTSFGHLLKDPNKEKLIGDCNQIVTLYAYLYSLKYPIEGIKIKLLPEHVCMHFEGIDIEATNGHFANYNESNEILDITELISTNLLDINDSRESQLDISPKIILKTSQLAYKISSKKELVAKNLAIAYKNLGITAMNEHNFESAVFFIRESGDRDLLLKCFYNAAIYYLNIKDFRTAKYYADLHGDMELKTTISLHEGHYLYEQNKTKDAIRIFKQLGKHEMIKACLEKDYYNCHQKIKDVKTILDAKKYKSVYQQMRNIAQELQDSEKQNWTQDILSKI